MEKPKKPSKRQPKPSEQIEVKDNPRELLKNILSPIQQNVLADRSRFILARCSRRAGKTFFDAAKLIDTALEFPGDVCVYFGLTKDSAREAIWDDLLKLLVRCGVPHKYSEAKLEVELFNKSRIRLIGADLDNIKDRLRGRRFRLVIVDECAFYTSVDNLILSVLLPTLSDFQGQLVMTSSPGMLPVGLFYEADQGGQKDSWSRYHWTGGDNPHFQQPATNPKFANLWEEELDTICRLQFKGDRDNPTFQREYLGQWVFDKRSLVYPLDAKYTELSKVKIKQPNYVIGINLSKQSEQSAVVLKYGEYNREVVVVEAYKFKAKNLDDLDREISELIDNYEAERAVCYLGDQHKDVLEDFKYRYKLPLVANSYDKTPFYQQIVSTDMENGYIWADLEQAADLIAEFKTVVKDEEGEEIANQNSLLSDAFFAVYLATYSTTLKQHEEEESTEDIMERQLREAVLEELEDFKDEYGWD